MKRLIQHKPGLISLTKRFLATVVLAALSLSFCTGWFWESNSSFSVTFIDVGQGDAALVECDGCYMLIDGGDTSAKDVVYDTLVDKGIQELDILAISHPHTDHVGGLTKALSYATTIDLVLCNTEHSDIPAFNSVIHELSINDAEITVPDVGDTYSLGSATVEVIDVSAEEDNDSLVLLITYGETTFLFTGDIEGAALTRISDKYKNESDEPFEISLMKLPHHGSYTYSLYRFLRTFMPDYTVISVGEDNKYGHPNEKTLNLLNELYGSDAADEHVFRTDKDGTIIVQSNGKELSIQTNN